VAESVGTLHRAGSGIVSGGWTTPSKVSVAVQADLPADTQQQQQQQQQQQVVGGLLAAKNWSGAL
jgi:hypothetical protein